MKTSEQPRYLTKSRFKLALTCPTKLYYDGKPEYANQKLEDSFLQSLAEGGFQVGELSKLYFSGGHEIETRNYQDAISQTNQLLRKDNVIIYEAAVCFANLFIRADILIKNGNNLSLIEVKSKSIDPENNSFVNKNGTISANWYEYIADVAFQKYVVNSALPDYRVSAYLMLADKSALCPTDGLNQKFKISKDTCGRTHISVSPALNSEDLSPLLLTQINVDDYCELVYQKQFKCNGNPLSFNEFIDTLSGCYARGEKIAATPSKECKGCEFKTTRDDEAAGLKNGFNECWKEFFNWNDEDFSEPNVLDIWNYRQKQKCLDEGRVKLIDINEVDINPKSDGKPGLSSSQRQWIQLQKAHNEDKTPWIDTDNLKKEMRRWSYPMHFIDFETSAVAIPFNKGRHPYEGIAFQFSHHIAYEDGRVKHHGQYLNTTPGFFPNYEFVRQLKAELEHDQGSIFRYAAHENSFLNTIYRQLREDKATIPDREDLCSFIRSITKSRGGQAEKWEGSRNMVDMWELVKRYYYDPSTNGSNSIKQVLPAILNSSKFLQEKYSQPIYGAEGGIPSLNFRDWAWIIFEDGLVLDPYKLLPKMFQETTDEELNLLSSDDELHDGGAAAMAYARMQFEDMSDYERDEISKALLKYCELDTLAMVMIYEGWKEMISNTLDS